MTVIPRREKPPAEIAAARVFKMEMHLDRRVFEQECCRLYQNGLVRCEMPDERVAGGMYQKQPGRSRRKKPVHEHPERIMCLSLIAVTRRVPDVRRKPVVSDVTC